jgi:hypothetical protein
MDAGHLPVSIVGTDGTVAATARESEFPGSTG